MTDAQQLFDYARQQFTDIADNIDRHFDLVTTQLREWLPADVRIYRAPPPPPKRLPPPTTLQALQRWIATHRALTAAGVAFVVTGVVGGVFYARGKQFRRKRRARRSKSGAREEVVVVVGAVASPVTNALYLDLERRGFLVYVVTNTGEEEQFVRSQGRVDLLPLQLDLVDPFAAARTLERFRALLARSHRVFEDVEAHRLRFAGLVLVPDTQTPPLRIEDISSEEWSDALNARVLNTIATTQLFLPSVTEYKAKILLLTPSVTPALKLPQHALESTVYGALEGFTSSLAAEMREQGVCVSHFKLGNFDIPSSSSNSRQRSETSSQTSRRLKATPLRRLHDAVFDALVAKRPWRTRYVGRGSLAYDVVGSWVPAGVVGWMMGAGRRQTGVVESEELLQGSWEKVEDVV